MIFCHRLVYHGRDVCTARTKPHCDKCCLEDICKKKYLTRKEKRNMALKAVHHIALLVSDYQKSKEFYVDKLGFRIVRENFREDRGDYKLDLILKWS